jgi:hypothetical protein
VTSDPSTVTGCLLAAMLVIAAASRRRRDGRVDERTASGTLDHRTSFDRGGVAVDRVAAVGLIELVATHRDPDCPLAKWACRKLGCN